MSKRWLIASPLFVLLIFLGGAVAHSADYQLPDTGIVRCYDGVGNIITCPSSGEAFYGQDAQYQGPQPAFAYQDNGDGTVSDYNTDLVWQQSDDGVERTWKEAVDYCNGLNYAFYADWRLPDRRELISIVDYGRYNPSIHPVFGCRSDYYWTSSTYAGDPDFAGPVYFLSGFSGWYDKSYTHYVRCVREGVGYVL